MPPMPPMEFNRCFCSICLYRPSVASMVRSTVCNVYFSATYYKNNFLKHQCGSGKKRRRMDPRATIIDRLVDIFEDQGNKGMAFWILEEEPWLSSMLLVCPMSREIFGHCTSKVSHPCTANANLWHTQATFSMSLCVWGEKLLFCRVDAASK